MYFAQVLIEVFPRISDSQNTKNFIFGLCSIIAVIILLAILLVLKFIFPLNFYLNINKINYENSEFLKKISSNISTEKVFIANHNENTIKLPDCSELYSSNDTAIEILYKCEEKLEFYITNLYGDEEVVKENENVYVKTNRGEFQNITKINCNDKPICQSKKLFNDEEWIIRFNDIVHQSTYAENENSDDIVNQSAHTKIENSNDTINNIDDTNFICQIVDKNRNLICYCTIKSPKVIIAPFSCFTKGKDELWIKDSKSQIYKMDDIIVHTKLKGISYNIVCGVIKGGYFKESQIAEICPSNQPLEEMLREQLAGFIREDTRLNGILCNTTLATYNGYSNNVSYGNYGYPLVAKDENTGSPCVIGSKLLDTTMINNDNKKEVPLQIFTNVSDNEINDFIEAVIMFTEQYIITAEILKSLHSSFF